MGTSRLALRWCGKKSKRSRISAARWPRWLSICCLAITARTNSARRRLPQFREAVVLNFIDDLDSKMGAIARLWMPRRSNRDDEWTERNPSLRRPLLRTNEFLHPTEKRREAAAAKTIRPSTLSAAAPAAGAAEFARSGRTRPSHDRRELSKLTSGPRPGCCRGAAAVRLTPAQSTGARCSSWLRSNSIACMRSGFWDRRPSGMCATASRRIVLAPTPRS